MNRHNPKHQSQMLTSRRLNSFFHDLNNTFKGKPVKIYEGRNLEHAPGDAEPVTLVAVTFSPEHHPKSLTIKTTKAGSPQSLTTEVNLVWVIREADGGVVAVEIIDEQNNKLLLEFA